MKHSLTSLAIGALLLLSTILPAAPARQFRKGDTWVAIGDSITHGRRYHSFIYLYYATRFPANKFKMYNCGISGDSAGGAVRRYSWDIQPHKGTIATILLGMNDVGRGNYGADRPVETYGKRQQSSIDGHIANMDKLSALLQKDNCDIIYLTPSIYDQTGKMQAKNLFGVNDALGTCGRRVGAELAPKYQAGIAYLHGPMTAINAEYQKEDLTRTIVGQDRVHPGDFGQFIMAYLFLKSQDVPATVANIAVDARGDVLTQDNCQIGDAQGNGTEVSFNCLENALPYPVPESAEEALDLVSFIKEMNQEILRVDGLQEGKYAVEIDDTLVLIATEKELATGVNLATNTRTPMYAQALRVMDIENRRHQIPARYLRGFAARKHFNRNKDIDPDNYEQMKAHLEKSLESMKKSGHRLYGYMKGQTAAYIKYKPQEKELTAEMEAKMDELWTVNQPQPHHFRIRPVTKADFLAEKPENLVDDFDRFSNWNETSWTNTKAEISCDKGIVTITLPRKEDVRDMYGISHGISSKLKEVKTINVRLRADKGAPFGMEMSIDGKNARLVNYVPASGEWQTFSAKISGKRFTGITLILAEGSANQKWVGKTATYEFDRVWFE